MKMIKFKDDDWEDEEDYVEDDGDSEEDEDFDASVEEEEDLYSRG